MLVLIFENQHQRGELRHVSSKQFHGRLEVVVGKSRNRLLQIDVRSPQGFLHFLGIGDGGGLCARIRCARKHAGEQAVLRNDQVEHVGNGANALAGLPVVPARHDAREPSEFLGKRSGIFCEGSLYSYRLRLRQRHHQSDRESARSVPSQNLHHLELLFVNKQVCCKSDIQYPKGDKRSELADNIRQKPTSCRENRALSPPPIVVARRTGPRRYRKTNFPLGLRQSSRGRLPCESSLLRGDGPRVLCRSVVSIRWNGRYSM